MQGNPVFDASGVVISFIFGKYTVLYLLIGKTHLQ